MRQLSFEGYIKLLLKKQSYAKSIGFVKLREEAELLNLPIKEAFLIYLFFHFTRSDAEKFLANTPRLLQEYQKSLVRFSYTIDLLRAFENESPFLPEAYKRIYRSYKVRRDSHTNEQLAKSLMRSRIVRLQKEKGITSYRIYTDLKLNPGNFNDFLKNGNADKLSSENIRRVIKYIEEKK